MSTQDVIAKIDANKDAFIQRLAEAVAIPSVSGAVKYRKEVYHMADWLVEQLRKVGASAELKPLGKQTLEEQEIDLPPAIFSQLGSDPNKKTLLIYGHYDVQPANKSDGWNTEPFVLTPDEKCGRLYGRGSTDDKGPILGWFNAIDAHQQAGVEVPVNLKFVFEGMEESGSVGLDELIVKEKDGFLAGVDAICISDNYWLAGKPCLTHGLRGIQYFKLQIQGPGADLHSGVFGGMVHEPMTDLIKILSQLVTPQGEILVPGIKEQVQPLTPEEAKRYEAMEFDIAGLEENVQAKIAISGQKEKVLMGRMRYPSLSLHGIEGAFSEAGTKTVIPAKVVGKFSLRLVPDMTPDKVVEAVTKYIDELWAKLGSKNKLTLEAEPGGKPWLADPNHWNYAAASKATEQVYGVTPDLTREGGSIPVALSFADTLEKNLVLLPMGRADDGAHSTNEKLDTSNFLEGSKVFIAYLNNVASLAQ